MKEVPLVINRVIEIALGFALYVAAGRLVYWIIGKIFFRDYHKRRRTWRKYY